MASDAIIAGSSDENEDQKAEENAKNITADLTSEILKYEKSSEQKREISPSISAKDITTRVLQFLSNANNETLGACFVGLGAVTYFILGRLGLILIGVAGGVILHAAWENEGSDQSDDATKALEARKRREKSLEIVSRLLENRGMSRQKSLGDKASAEATTSSVSRDLDFSGFQKETKEALDEFADAVIRDYVRYWYSPMLPDDQTFPRACRQTLTRFFLMMSNQMARKRPADTFLDFLTNSSSIMIVFLSELANALRSAPGMEPLDAIEQYNKENPECSLSNVLDQVQQERKLKGVADDILQNFLDVSSYGCEPVRTFLCEVLAGLILETTVVTCSQPDSINEWIIYMLEDGETTELVQAIDAGVSGATADGSAVASLDAKDENLIESKEVISEEQARAIGHKRTLSRAEVAMEEAMHEARRLTEMIAAEEAKNGQEPGSGQSSSDDAIKRLVEIESPSEIGSQTTASPPGTGRGMPTLINESQDPEMRPAFTNFDQIISSTPTALQSDGDTSKSIPIIPMTLLNASVSIFDDSTPGEKSAVKSKPSGDYLLQIEPALSHYPGWMIPRKYSDFETLHEVLRRLSVISGATTFTEKHQTLPSWKGKTKTALRQDLEKYLQDALSLQSLAESEGMKRFLEKAQGLQGSSPGANKTGFGFPNGAAFDNVGKGVLDVLSIAPKGAATGGKAIVGGVTGVFGGLGAMGQKKQGQNKQPGNGVKLGRQSTTSLPQLNPQSASSHAIHSTSTNGAIPVTDELSLSRQTTLGESQEHLDRPPLPARPIRNATISNEAIGSETAELQSDLQRSSFSHSDIDLAHVVDSAELPLNLPPLPSEIPDDYSTVKSSSSTNPSFEDSDARTSTSTNPASSSAFPNSAGKPVLPARPSTETAPVPSATTTSTASQRPRSSAAAAAPLTLAETSVAIELFFAGITELYSLSSAWTLRLTLLSAAKSFLLRPSNPNLDAIRHLIQSTLIDPYTSDTGVAALIRQTRRHAMPTAEESLAATAGPQPAPTVDQLEERRLRARKLLVERGMPTAITGVMGAAASGEALGKVFDCLQSEKVARGLVFAVVLQGVRAVVQ